MRSKFEFCDVPAHLPSDAIVIRDVGHDQGYVSVTNDAEAVVGIIARSIGRAERAVPRIFYYDSDGRLDELCHDGLGNFTEFKSGPQH